MRDTSSLWPAAGRGLAAAFVLSCLSVFAGPAAAQQTGGYGVACADGAYFDARMRQSPVELYIRIDEPMAAQRFLRQATGGTPDSTVDALIVLYTPAGGSRVGVIPFAEGCALEAGFLSPKMAVDQVLAGLLHQGLLD